MAWLYAGLIAAPMIGLFIASKKYGGWVWPMLFILSVIATIGIGYRTLHRVWQQEDDL